MNGPRRQNLDAIIFIPGVGTPWEDDLVKGLGSRLASALTNNHLELGRLESVNGSDPSLDQFGIRDYARVFPSGEEGADKDLLHAYYPDLPRFLTEPYSSAAAPRKAFELGYHILSLAPKVIFGILSRDKEWRVQLQLFIGVAVTLLMVTILSFILFSLVVSLVGLLPGVTGMELIRDWFLPISAAATGAFVMLPRRFRSFLDSATIFLLPLFGYVAAGAKRGVVVGKLASLIRHVALQGKYDRIHIVSYSIGSIIALDSLYPTTTRIKGFDDVDSLVAVGCPADIIQTYWPDYFKDRFRPDKRTQTWINVFIPSDLFASNFIAGDTRSEEPPTNTSDGNENALETPAEGEEVLKAGRWWVGVSGPAKVSGRIASAPGRIIGSSSKAAFRRFFGQANWTPIEFRTEGDSDEGRPKVNVRHVLVPQSGGADSAAIMAAATAHQSYWDRTNPDAAGAFDTIAQELPFSCVPPHTTSLPASTLAVEAPDGSRSRRPKLR